MSTFIYFEPFAAMSFILHAVLPAAAADPRVSALRLVSSAEVAERFADVIEATGLELTILSPEELAPLHSPSRLDRGRAQWSYARELLQTSGGHVFLPYFDHAIFGTILDRRWVNGTISGIIFRPPNPFGLPMTLKRRANLARRWSTYAAARRPGLGTLFTFDESVAENSGTSLWRLQYLPDPAPEPALLRNATPKVRADARKWFLLFGGLTERKGIFTLLEAINLLSPQVQATSAFRLVGRLHITARERFLNQLEHTRTANPNVLIELEDRFVEDAELAQEVQSCDVVLAPYQNHIGSSSVMLWAAAAGKRLITQNTGYMGLLMQQHNLGIAIDTTDPKALAAALSAPLPEGDGTDPFVATRTAQIAAKTVLDGCLQ